MEEKERTEGMQDGLVRIVLPADEWFADARESFETGDYARTHAAATMAQALDHRALLANSIDMLKIAERMAYPVMTVDPAEDPTKFCICKPEHRPNDPICRFDPPPRSWSLPPEPGPEVTAVRCECHGRWSRDGFGCWQLTRPNLVGMGPYRMVWSSLMKSCADLSDAPQETPDE